MNVIKTLKGDQLSDWHRELTKNGVPYYKNCRLETSQWYHPDYVLLLQSTIQRFRGTCYTAYRMAQKVSHLRDTLGVNVVSLQTTVSAFASVGLTSSDCNDDQISVAVLEALLENLYSHPASSQTCDAPHHKPETARIKHVKNSATDDKKSKSASKDDAKYHPCGSLKKSVGGLSNEETKKKGDFDKVSQSCSTSADKLDKAVCVELLLNLMLNLFDQSRSGVVPVLGCKLVLSVLCGGDVSLQRVHVFIAAQLTGHAGRISRATLHKALLLLARLPELLGEELWFGRQVVPATLDTVFCNQESVGGISSVAFCTWLRQEPQTLVWWSTLYRLTCASRVRHTGLLCCGCGTASPTGLLYVCRQCPDYVLCQLCFFTGRCCAPHSSLHAVQEHCSQVQPRQTPARLRKSPPSPALTQRYLPLPCQHPKGLSWKPPPGPGASRRQGSVSAGGSSPLLPARTVSPAYPGDDVWSVSIVPDESGGLSREEISGNVRAVKRSDAQVGGEGVVEADACLRGALASKDDKKHTLAQGGCGGSNAYEKIEGKDARRVQKTGDMWKSTGASTGIERAPLKPLNDLGSNSIGAQAPIESLGKENAQVKKKKKGLLNKLFRGTKLSKKSKGDDADAMDMDENLDPCPFVRNNPRSRSVGFGSGAGPESIYGGLRYGSCRMNSRPASNATGSSMCASARKSMDRLEETLLQVERQNSTNKYQLQRLCNFEINGTSPSTSKGGDSPRRQLASVISQLQDGYSALRKTRPADGGSAALLQEHSKGLAHHITALRGLLQKMNGPVGVVSPCPRSLLDRPLHPRVPSFESSTPIGGPGPRPRMPLPNGARPPSKNNKLPSDEEDHFKKPCLAAKPIGGCTKSNPVVAGSGKPKTSSWSSLSPIVPSAGDSARALNDTAVLMNIRNTKTEALGVVEAERAFTPNLPPAGGADGQDAGLLYSTTTSRHSRLPSFTEVSFSDLSSSGCFRRRWSDEDRRPASKDLYSASCDAVLSATGNLNNATYVGHDPTIIGSTRTDRNPAQIGLSSTENSVNCPEGDRNLTKDGGGSERNFSENHQSLDKKNSSTATNDWTEKKFRDDTLKNSLLRQDSDRDNQNLGEDCRTSTDGLQETATLTASSSTSSASLGTSCAQLQLELEDLLQQLEAMISPGGVTANSGCGDVVTAAEELGDCLADFVCAVPRLSPASS